MFLHRRLPQLIASTSLVACSPAWAQVISSSHVETAPPVAASPSNPDEANDIIVTAQKREQHLQDVGLSITALGADTLSRQRVETVADLTKVIPGLVATPSPTGTPVYTLRGVGFFESSLSAAPDVALYIDQAPLTLPAFAAQTAFDLERVEVLKGPQGTLFGSNATGGAINFVAAKPTRDFRAGIEIGYGRFNTVDFSGFVSGPLTDTLRARLAVKVKRGDDWQRSYTRNDTLGEANTAAGRLLLEWKPTDRLNLLLNVNAWRDKSDPQAPQLARAVTNAPGDLQHPIGTCSFFTGLCVTPGLPVLNYPPAPHDPRAADWIPHYRPFQDTKFAQATLTANYDVTGDVTLTSLTSYIRYSHRKAQSLSGLALEDVDNPDDHGRARDFSQELRLAQSTGPFRWVLGGNYARTEVYQYIQIVFTDASSGYSDGGTTSTSFDQSYANRQLAAFGNVEYDIAPHVTLKGGVRYTDALSTSANKTFETPGYIETRPGALNATLWSNFAQGNFIVPALACAANFVPAVSGGSVSLDQTTCQFSTFHGRLHEHNVSWNAGIDYKPNRNILLYANISKGYKAGTFPLTAAGDQRQYGAVKQESLLSYEAGFKTTLADGRIIFNGAAFYYDYKNKQLRSKFVDALFGALDLLRNVPKSRIKGIELDLTALPVRGLTVRLAGTYLDAKIKEYLGTVGQTLVNGKFVPIEASFAGVQLPFTPEWQGTASFDYSFPVTRELNGFLGSTLAAQTQSIGSPQLSPSEITDARVKGYATLDLRAGFGAADHRWTVTFWGKNVTNSYYWTNALRNYDTVVRYAGRPVEYGISFGAKF
ncbi:MAG: hypothetical protein JWR80_9326 [Bradyrhizobium sp.]|nr:hypothetical protein [Bradyrhizobium sp.]